MAPSAPKKGAPGPLLGTIWWFSTVGIIAYVASCVDCTAYHLLFGYRSGIALLGYLIMQIGLWNAEQRWDEMGSTAYLEAAKKDKEKVSGAMSPEELDEIDFGTMLSFLRIRRRKPSQFPGDSWWVGGYGG